MDLTSKDMWFPADIHDLLVAVVLWESNMSMDWFKERSEPETMDLPMKYSILL